MQRNILIFSVACCVILAGINLMLNYQLYSLVKSGAYPAEAGDVSGAADESEPEDAAAFSNTGPSLAEREAAAGFEDNAPGSVSGAFRSNGAADGAGGSFSQVAALSENPPLYLLGMKDGYIAVFYGAGGGNVVKEITALPAGALPFDEKLRLSQGIPVYDEGQLAKLLQDYGS